MADFERNVSVSSDPGETFKFLADPANLPRYIADMTAARPESGDRLHVAAQVEGRHEEGDAQFRVDSAAHRLDWGAEGSSYHGWVQVEPATGGSSVTIRLHVPDESNATEINRVLDETGSNLQQLLGNG